VSGFLKQLIDTDYQRRPPCYLPLGNRAGTSSTFATWQRHAYSKNENVEKASQSEQKRKVKYQKIQDTSTVQ
jgi:hypothetical protein